jgi:hypothetical protein
MTLSALGIFSAAGAGGVQGDYELISTTLISSNTPSVTFDVSSFASTYKHLQLRQTTRSTNNSTEDFFYLRFNSQTTGYTNHSLGGTGSIVFSGNETSSYPNGILSALGTTGATSPTSAFGAGVIDLLDPFATTKNKTVRLFSGNVNTAYFRLGLSSGSWMSTNATTSISVHALVGSFVSGSRFSLYGIRG